MHDSATKKSALHVVIFAAHIACNPQGEDKDQWVQGSHADAIRQGSAEGAQEKGTAHSVPCQQLQEVSVLACPGKCASGASADRSSFVWPFELSKLLGIASGAICLLSAWLCIDLGPLRMHGVLQDSF